MNIGIVGSCLSDVHIRVFFVFECMATNVSALITFVRGSLTKVRTPDRGKKKNSVQADWENIDVSSDRCNQPWCPSGSEPVEICYTMRTWGDSDGRWL